MTARDHAVILWCDDDAQVMRAYERIAADLDAGPIDFATSAREACGILAERRHRVLVTDLRMPGMDGLDLCRWARDWSPTTRRVLCTAYPDDELLATDVCGLVDALIAKPFNLDDMRAVLFAQLAQHRRTDPSFPAVTTTDEELAQARRAAAVAVHSLRASATPDRRSDTP